MNDGFDFIQKRVRQSAVAADRDPSSIRIVAVSKKVSVERVEKAIETGIHTLGESYIQEAREKIASLSHLPVSWHFIGHLQSNKAKYAVRLFDLIHSVDSLKLARELNRQAKKIAKQQEILLQINIAKEESKSGVSTEDTLHLIREVACLENLKIKGLMTMPPFFHSPEKARPFFRSLRKLSRAIENKNIPNVHMDELSMGMSGDFETAISEGATLVRIGTAIFGSRL